MSLQGEVFRHQKERLTQRIRLGNQHYFIKQHRGIGFKELFKNLFQARLPIISAKNEWSAIQKLTGLNVATPKLLGYGERGKNIAKLESFVLMEELTDTISLEDLAKTWLKQRPAFNHKHRLIKEVARIARSLHQNGINHRDFYICHFLIHKNYFSKQDAPVYLIDLHRAGIRKLTPKRWLIKDLAGLYFSSKDILFTKRDVFRFMKYYRQKNLREIIKAEQPFWQQVKSRGDQLYRDHYN